MLKEKIVNAINGQINKEIFSSYLYLSMAAYFDSESLTGMSNYMKVQAQEEMSHAMILYNYINERGGRVVLDAIEAPQVEFASVMAVFEKNLEHEEFVTESINNLMALAVDEKDFATQNRLEWFVGEQVEEEANASDIIAKLKLVGDGAALFMLDAELGKRVFAMPSPLAGNA